MPDYVPIETAKTMSGLRLVLTAIPGPPWTEAAKAVFHVKKIPYAPVAQMPIETNDALERWTGHSNAPIAVYENEKARAGWAEILFLAERLEPEPPLIPAEIDDRVRFFGLAHELCGEDGFGWNRRHLMVRNALEPRDDRDAPREIAAYLGQRYGYSDAAGARAGARVVEILRLLSAQLRAQKERGRRFLVGDRLSAVDLYWATFAVLIEPLPRAMCALPDWLRKSYTVADPTIRGALDPALLEHRDRIYADHLELPIDG
jgi:glutathione S-transferase